MAADPCWALVPAAGAGTRMGADIPKQYLPLQGTPILSHTLQRLQAQPELSGIMVVLSEHDTHWPTLPWNDRPDIHTTIGGTERFHSVLNGLHAIAQLTPTNPWILVHDAARPCVRNTDISRLINTCRTRTQGGLLGHPVSDTLKRADNQAQVIATLDRTHTWHAYTPQMFRLQALTRALTNCIERGEAVTDEASAMEACGHAPLLVQGHRDNLKITLPEDLPFAQAILAAQQQESQ